MNVDKRDLYFSESSEGRGDKVSTNELSHNEFFLQHFKNMSQKERFCSLFISVKALKHCQYVYALVANLVLKEVKNVTSTLKN